MGARLTRAGIAVATTGLSLLGFGMAMANLELIVAAALPLILLALPLSGRPRETPHATRSFSTRTPRRGDDIDVDVRTHVPRGGGLVETHMPVPDGFSLEAGSNLVVHARQGDHLARFRIAAHARGRHEFPPVRVERIDPHGLLAPDVMEVGAPEHVEVTARTYHTDRLRRRARGKARLLLPDLQEARLGVGSSDFRELREYAWGDPPKAINWKATARRLSSRAGMGDADAAPMVNEYEKEGRRSVIVLLDGGDEVRVGTSLETGLDHAVEAALATARLFLGRGARVGAATFHAGAGHAAAPDSGTGRMPGIERALKPSEPDASRTPLHVLQSIEPHLAGSRPLVLVVTRITPNNAPALAELARRIRVLLHERRRTLPIIVVDVKALELVPADTPAVETAQAIARLEDEAAARAVARAGARVVPWRPAVEDLRGALLRRGLA